MDTQSRRLKTKIVATNIHTWKTLFFESESECVDFFGVRQSTINQAKLNGFIFNESWIIKDFSNISRKEKDASINYQTVFLSRPNLFKMLSKEVDDLNEKYRSSLKDAVQESYKTIYLLDDNLKIKGKVGSYKETAKLLGVPIGTVRSRLNRVFIAKEPTICRACDYLDLVNN